MHALPAPAPAAPPARDFNLFELPAVLWRRRWIILVLGLAGWLGARAFIATLAPVYTASAQVLIAPHAPLLDLHTAPGALRGDAEDVASEVYVLRSRDLAARVVDRLNLTADPAFNLTLRPVEADGDAGADAGADADTDSPPPATLTPAQQRDLAAAVLSGSLEVVPVGRSRVIAITARAASADQAAVLANAVAGEYLAAQMDAKRTSTGDANAWLGERTAALEAEVREREAAVETYRARAGLTRGAGADRLSAEEMSGLSTQLVLARAEHAAARARLDEAERRLSDTGGKGASGADLLDAPLVRTLREREAEARRTLAELDQEYGPRHPRMVQARAQLDDARQAIRAEADKLLEGLRNDARVAAARERSLASTLDGLKARSASLDRGEVQLRALEREADTSRALLETFLARTKETAAVRTLAPPDARIIAHAVAPFGPSWPNPRLLQLLATSAALGIGVLLAFLREGLDHSVRTPAALEQLTGTPVLAAVPRLGGSLRRRAPAEWVLRARRSEYSESLRRAHTALLLREGGPARVVLMASALPGEGKTSTVLALGRLLAGAGRRVVAVDLNLRNPTLHRAAGITGSGGLAAWLAGEAHARHLRRDPASELWLLPAGTVKQDPGVVLASPALTQLLAHLRERFDLVLLDSSPVLAVADAQFIARQADATVLLVRAGATSREAVLEAQALLTQAAGQAPEPLLNGARTGTHATRRSPGFGAYWEDHGAPGTPRRALPAPPARA